MKKFIFISGIILICSPGYSQTDTGFSNNPKGLPITVKTDPKALPITVKPDPKNLPITVKPSPTKTTAPNALPITVKNDPRSLPITVKPGDKIFSAGFFDDAVGEMPANWKTNKMGEIRMVNEQKWLRISESTDYVTGLTNTLPDSYKIEFDVLADFNVGQAVPYITLTLFNKGEKFREPGIWFTLAPNGGNSQQRDKVQLSTKKINGTNHFTAPATLIKTFSEKNKAKSPIHVTLTVNKQNVKAWIDSEKVYDVAEALPENIKLNRMGFEISSYGGERTNYDYYISNIQITAL